MNKILEILSKFGILRYGGTAGVYKDEAMPTEYEYMKRSWKKGDVAEKDGSNPSSGVQKEKKDTVGNMDTPLWMVIASWVLGVLFWVIALSAFVGGDNLIGFWMALAGLVTAHHTNKLLALVGVDLSLKWRAIVVAVCLVVLVVTI